eukprot:PhM_4_TR12667/c0_g1_i1/m.70780
MSRFSTDHIPTRQTTAATEGAPPEQGHDNVPGGATSPTAAASLDAALNTKEVVSTTSRGKVLFARPDWHRPWRSGREEKIANILALKEEEIEQHINRNNDLRVQLAKASAEIQNMSVQHQRQLVECEHARSDDIRRLEVQIADLRNELERERARFKFNLDAVKIERDEATRQLNAQLHTVQANMNDTCSLHVRQLQDVRDSAMREVDLNVKMNDLKSTELAEELSRTKAQLHEAMLLRERTIKELQGEMAKQQELYLGQVRETQRRMDALRTSYQEEMSAVSTERDSLRTQLTKMDSERIKSEGAIRDTESRILDWNTRVLSELDQLYEFYVRSYSDEGGSVLNSTALDEVRRHAAAVLFSPVKRAIGGETKQEDGRPSADEAAGTVVRILDRLHALNSLRSQHQDVINKLLQRIRSMEAQATDATQSHRAHSEHQDAMLSKLQADLSLVRNRHDRLQEALDESRSAHVKALQKLEETQVRLEFFLNDQHAHEGVLATLRSRGVTHPPLGTATLVVTGVQGAAAMFEKHPTMMRTAMNIVNDALRMRCMMHGGFEAKSNADSMLIAFSSHVDAIRFCLDVQTTLVAEKQWSSELLAHFDAAEVTSKDGAVLFRGLRVAMAMHTGEVCVDETNTYFGPTLTHAVALASHTCGGQILLSGTTWNLIRDDLETVGHPSVTDLQEHRLPPSDMMLRVVQLLPYSLRERGFTSILERKAMGVVYGASEFIRMSTQSQVSCCRNLHGRLDANISTLLDEASSLNEMVKAVGSRLREMQVNVRVYTTTDIVTNVAVLDRVCARLDGVQKDLERTRHDQLSLTNAIRVLEESFTTHHRASLTDEEFRRRVSVLQERSQEALHEQHLSHEHQTQQLRNTIHRLEGTITDMKAQLQNGTVEALQNQLTRERSKHEQATKELATHLSQMSQQLQKERLLTRFQNVPRVGDLSATQKHGDDDMQDALAATATGATSDAVAMATTVPATSTVAGGSVRSARTMRSVASHKSASSAASSSRSSSRRQVAGGFVRAKKSVVTI